MGMIESTIRLKNQMNPVLENIVSSMNMVISSAYDVQNATSKAFDTATLDVARERLSNAALAIEEAKNEQEAFNEQLERGSNHANKLKNMIKGVVGVYASIRGIKAFGGLSDEMTGISARLNMIKGEHESLIELQEKIYAAAQRSRGSYINTLDIVSKLGLQAKDAFSNTDETIAFAENLNKLFKIAGADSQEIASASLQLKQSLGSGVLRGEEFNAVFEAAPIIVGKVADYMGVTKGEMRKLAEEGLITADTVKNALLGASDEINKEFDKTSKTFGQIASNMKNRFIHQIEPALKRLNDFANSKDFEVFSDRSVRAIGFIATAIEKTVSIGIKGANLMAKYWDYLEVPVLAVAGALATYNTVAFYTSTIAKIQAGEFVGLSLAQKLYALATGQATLAQIGLNTAILTSPIFWIPAVIGGITLIYYKWAKSVGGVGIANKIVLNNIKNYLADFRINSRREINNVLDNWENYKIGIGRMKVGVLNHLEDLRVKGLLSLQNFINGAIEGINKLISLVNNIPGVSINAVEKVTFATNAKVEAETIKKKREAELEKTIDMADRNKRLRNSKLNDLESRFSKERFVREKEIAKLKAEKQKETEEEKPITAQFDIPAYTDLPEIAKDIKKGKEAAKGTKKNTDKLKDGIEVKNDDISHLKDLAEMRAIQNFSFEKLEVVANNSFGDIHETADLDGWMDNLTDNLAEAVNATMGGVVAYE